MSHLKSAPSLNRRALIGGLVAAPVVLRFGRANAGGA